MRPLKIAFLILFFCILWSRADAQLCQGSLGDPIVNITFGAGSNPGPSLAAATTTYQYLGTDCPNDGFYTVRSNTNSCFSSSWHNLSSDHTGDPNGYFMLVNASFQPSAFYVDTVRGLCAGTTYEFAAWIVNVLKTSACNANGIQPNLTFSIEKTDGTVIQSYNTGNIPQQSSPVWQQFGFFFATPANASDIVLRIFNNAPGGCGNDLALDDITFRPCGPQLMATINGDGLTDTLCQGTPASYTFSCTVSTGFNNPSFQWQQSINGGVWTDIPLANATTLFQNFSATTTPGIYRYRLTAAEAGNMGTPQCRVSSDVLSILVATNPITNASSNSPICATDTILLSASGGLTYQWSGPAGFTNTGSLVTITNATVAQSGKYYVLVANKEGCSKLDSVIASVNPNPVATTSFPSTTMCEGDRVQLNSSGGTSYQWMPATGLSSATIPNPVASPADTATYSVIVANQFGCKDTATVTVNTIEAPRADAGPDKTIMSGQTTQLQGAVYGPNTSYSWSPLIYMTNNQGLQPEVNPPHDTSYVLTVVSNDGCGTDTDTAKVWVFRDIYIPNSFTPNNDGLNDTWYIPALAAFPNFELSVFDRFGQLLYRCKNSYKPWDGKYKGQPLPAGAYVYMIDLKQENIKKLFKGTILIIR